MKGIIKTNIVVLLSSVIFFAGVSAEELLGNPGDVEPLPVFDCLIEPGEIVDVSSPVPGVIQKIYADRGDYVELGMPLSKLDSTVEQASLELARTRANSTVEIELQHENAEFSKRLHSRNQELFRKSVISSHDMDRFETEQLVAEMQERQAKNNNRIAQLEFRRALELLNQRTILSPIKGVVMERYKSAGEYVDEEPLLRLAQLDPLRIEIIVMADYWGRLLPGQLAEVTPQFSGLVKKMATIERIDPVVDSASGTFRVQLRLPNPDHQITAGLKCRLFFLPEKNETATVSADELLQSVEEGTVLPSVDVSDNEDPVTVSESVLPSEVLTDVIFDQSTAGFPLSSFQPVSLSIPDLQSGVVGYQTDIYTKRCFAVGPVAEADIAQQLTEQLETQSLNLTLQQMSQSIVQDYVVHSIPSWTGPRSET